MLICNSSPRKRTRHLIRTVWVVSCVSSSFFVMKITLIHCYVCSYILMSSSPVIGTGEVSTNHFHQARGPASHLRFSSKRPHNFYGPLLFQLYAEHYWLLLHPYPNITLPYSSLLLLSSFYLSLFYSSTTVVLRMWSTPQGHECHREAYHKCKFCNPRQRTLNQKLWGCMLNLTATL